jgi:hypothetical protein
MRRLLYSLIYLALLVLALGGAVGELVRGRRPLLITPAY